MRGSVNGSLVWLLFSWPFAGLAQVPADPAAESTPTARSQQADSTPVNGPPLILREAGNAGATATPQGLDSGQQLEPATPGTGVTATSSQSETPPLVLRSAGKGELTPREVEAVILELRERMRVVAESSISAAEKQAEAEKVVSEYPLIFRAQSTQMPEQKPRTVEGVIDLLEQRLFEVVTDAAPDEQTRKTVRENWALEEVEVNRPILIARKAQRGKIIVTSEAEEQGYTPWWKTAAAAQEQAQPKPTVEEESAGEDAEEEAVAVEFLADEQVTAEMHDDTTVLRDVEDDEGDLVLFDRLHLWVGGSGQLDVHSMDGLFRHDHGGDRDSDVRIRRAEGILRASLGELGEIKVQYDFDSTVMRDLYWRWLSDSTSQTVTIGNQKESLGLDYLMGNKFGIAMERSAPASAFGSYRSKGVRYNHWFDLSPKRTLLDVWGENRSYATSTLGIYTEDIDSSHETDWAVTGRLTRGAQRQDNSSIHLGVSGSYREGDFEQIAPRPELQEASRIPLADFEADKQVVVGFEAMYSRGSLHGQAEAYYSDYRGGKVDAEGFGGYVQAGWLFGGHERSYRARWGLWAPVNPRLKHVFEVFGRLSYTRGEDDNHTWNDLRLLTLGGSWYYRQIRGSVNLLLAQSRRDVSGEDAGNAITARIQYLF